MYAIIPILHLILTPNFALLESNEPTEADLECLNDYDKELVCQMKLKNCSEYNLNVSLEIHSSSFQHFPPSTCEWKFQVHFFVPAEKFAARLWRGDKILFTKYISTLESIKPKRPINLSVKRTDNGNFVITWNTNYTKLLKTFIESLSPQLEYGVKGSGHYETLNVTAGLQKYEIVGRNLKPNSDYVVKARVSTKYNNNMRFSDYSEEYEFRTTSSTQDILKIIIPIVCVILIIFISTVFYCYIQVIRKWCEKIPSPKIAPIFVNPHYQVAQLSPFQNISAFEFSKWDPDKEKPWISPAQVDVSGNLYSPENHSDSSPVIYAQTVEGNSSGSEVQCELLEEYKSTEGVQVNKANTETPKEYGNDSGSSFNNKCYLGLNCSGSSFLKDNTPLSHPTNESENLNQDLEVDFDYCPCNGCLLQSAPCSTETALNELLTNKLNQINNNVNLILAKTTKFPQDVPMLICEDTITSADHRYQQEFT